MILVDTSVWVDHFRNSNARLERLLADGTVLSHPFVTGELALGNLRKRNEILTAVSNLPAVMVASDAEVLVFIEARGLYGRGIGYVDAHLLASTRLAAGVMLWTGDRSLNHVASEMSLSAH